MKKTLLTVVCLAMGMSFAYAQTNSVSMTPSTQDQAVVAASANAGMQASYKGSIFTKAGELFICDFSTASASLYTTGTAGANSLVNDTVIPQHQRTETYAEWNRLNDTTAAYLATVASTNNYPYTFQGANGTGGFRSLNGFNSATPTNGLMIMTMQDQVAGWGGNGTAGSFDAYIAFSAFSTASAPVVDVRLYQYYRVFNRDRCFIDYSTDNSRWKCVEFNVRGIDVGGSQSDTYNGWVTITLPLETAGAQNLYLRLRWESNSNAGGAYGYIWMVDDFTVLPGAANRITVKQYQFYEGFYQQMPKGLRLPMNFTATFRNTGTAAQNNLKAELFTYDENNTTPVSRASAQLATSVAADATTDVSVSINPLGRSGIQYDNSVIAGTRGVLPTNLDNETAGYVYADITASNLQHAYADGSTFDTVAYRVNQNTISAMPGAGVWGHEHGAVRNFCAWIHGKNADGYLVTNRDNAGWNRENYRVTLAYVTGDSVPAGWVIQGVQFVTSTYPGDVEAGVQIDATCTYDSVTGGSVYFNEVTTGATTHTVTSDEIVDRAGLTYRTPGNYNVITIPFPEQPALEPMKTYRVGYRMPSDGFFAVAQSSNFYYDLDTNAVAYDTVAGMKDYRNSFGNTNYGTTLMFDPNVASWTWMGSNSAYPMIRMIVGPARYIPKYLISFECGENGAFLDSRYNSVCGNRDSVAQGSTHVFYAMGDDGYVVDQVFDGDSPMQYTTRTASDGSTYAEINLANVQAAHALRATFKAASTQAVNEASQVSMKLYPNPATSNVRLSINGVEGQVNYSLIDMSGRVVRTATVNAEVGANIDLSNLAKGAYFVRITNNNFSKVEKLVVR